MLSCVVFCLTLDCLLLLGWSVMERCLFWICFVDCLFRLVVLQFMYVVLAEDLGLVACDYCLFYVLFVCFWLGLY